MRAGRFTAGASWALAILAAVAATGALLIAYVDRTILDTDGFGARADAALTSGAVRAAVARRVVDAAITAKPDLVAARPLLESAVAAVIGTDAFRSLFRAAARDIHRSAFDRHAPTVTLTLADAGILAAQAVQRLSPDVAKRVPQGFDTRLARIGSGLEGIALRVTEHADRGRFAAPLALVAAVLFAIGSVALTRPRRSGVVRVGLSTAVAAGLVVVAAAIAPLAAASAASTADHPAVRALLAVWLTPLAIWAAALAAAGMVAALAAASVLRPFELGPTLHRAWTAVSVTPRATTSRAARALAAAALGVALIRWPVAMLSAAATVAGALLVLAAIAEVLRLGATTSPRRPRAPRRRRLRLATTAAMTVAAVAGAAAVAAMGTAARAGPVGRCNGFRALCDRRLDQVAFAGTHNSMAADREPGWLFVAQDAGIDAQLRDGIRALMIDTHYGVATPRGVVSDLAAGSKSRKKIVDQLGESFVRTAERLRARIGYRGGGQRVPFLCHAYCEVGATKAVDALAGVHRFLVTHPDEVIVLSIEDDTSAADTADVIRRSGLIDEVYRGAVGPPWPTLRALIDRDERVLVLAENHPGGAPWIHSQPAVAQETPYHFASVAQLAKPDSCRPNRGGTSGSLLIVNHWVDTSPAPRPSIADEVNARPFLDRRLAACRRTRNVRPNIVAVDFYRRGDVLGVVNALNGIR